MRLFWGRMEMAQVSSDELFHFTHTLENLQSILLHGFYPRCSFEDVSFIFDQLEKENAIIGHCMVCFCDLPIELQTAHKRRYGEYGIALCKAWGMSKGISPVMYVYNDASVIKELKHMSIFIKGFLQPENRRKKIMKHKVCQRWLEYANEIFGSFNQLIGYLKLYSNQDKEIRYYDEREWRYLFPWITEESKKLGMLNVLIGKDCSKENQNALNLRMEKYPLRFELRDICKIILPTDADRDSMIKFICENEEYLQEKYADFNKGSVVDKICVIAS